MHNAPLIIAREEGYWVGLEPITWAFDPITIHFMGDQCRHLGGYLEIFELISLLEVCQEGGG